MKKSEKPMHRTTINVPRDLLLQAEHLVLKLKEQTGENVTLTDVITAGLRLIVQRERI